MKHEVLDPVDEGDNANTNLAAADIANAENKANLLAPTSMGLTSQDVNTSPNALHGHGHAASATGTNNPAVAAGPFGGRLRVRNPCSGRLVRVPQMRPSVPTQELAHLPPQDSPPHYELNFVVWEAMNPAWKADTRAGDITLFELQEAAEKNSVQQGHLLWGLPSKGISFWQPPSKGISCGGGGGGGGDGDAGDGRTIVPSSGMSIS
ncbi:hypothetical protein CFIO01_01218 [Colletotrichum fioriniae PJ7]|uniref:Uncharacterized protein n=1 Tax=Colletotrichum fioriniae PJ7 TaxID=1445577 RepID=A0A010QLC5_9PEZI|nr:hypothetical protein CFIO01_01218 [Colletotrichum fioriniae PJ7]